MRGICLKIVCKLESQISASLLIITDKSNKWFCSSMLSKVCAVNEVLPASADMGPALTAGQGPLICSGSFPSRGSSECDGWLTAAHVYSWSCWGDGFPFSADY